MENRDPYREYKAGNQKRESMATQARQERYRQSQVVVENIKQFLTKHKCAKRAYLFGSMTTPEDIRIDSDIDIALAGVVPSQWFNIVNQIEDLSPAIPLSLIDLDHAKPYFRQRVLEGGSIIYECE